MGVFAWCASSMGAPMTDTLSALGTSVATLLPELIEIRRDLHAHPELARLETRTTDLVAARLEAAGVSVRRLSGTGLVADIGRRAPSTGLRCAQTWTRCRCRSRPDCASSRPTTGVCHACGHDVHVAALLGRDARAQGARAGAARARHRGARASSRPPRRSSPAVRTKPSPTARWKAWTPSSRCTATRPRRRPGRAARGPDHRGLRPHQRVAHGRGGHTSRPQLTEDLTYALAKVVTDVPAALSRRLDPRAGAALVWGTSARDCQQRHPETGECQRHSAHARRQRVAHRRPTARRDRPGGRAPYGVQATVERIKGVPPVVNRLRHRGLALCLPRLGAADRSDVQSLGGEDFSWYLAHTAGAMARLGTRTPGGRTYDLHQGDVVIDEDAIACGARLLASVVVARGQGGRRDSPRGRGSGGRQMAR